MYRGPDMALSKLLARLSWLGCTCMIACVSPLESGLLDHTMPIDKNGHLAQAQAPVAQPLDAHGAPIQTSPERAHAMRIAKAFHDSGKKKVLLYLHGGLVSLRKSAEESRVLERRMEADGYFPVFVNWETGFGTSYGGHLTRGRNGRPSDANSRAAAPLRFLLDTVDIAANAPRAWAASASDSVHSNALWHKINDPTIMRDLPPCDGKLRLVCSNPGTASRAKAFGRGVQWTLQSPFKLLFTPIVYTGGEAAWFDMVRRTQLVFANDDEFWPERTIRSQEPQGALSVLLQELLECDDTAVHVTIVAHSMGTIVSNAILSRYLNDPRLELDRVVYLGSAAAVGESLRAVSTYLQAHPNTHFFNVMLHPRAEDRERSAAGFAPDGSLLVWIDSMYGHPHSFVERTFGRWLNVKTAMHLIPGPDDGDAQTLRKRMHFRVLAAESGPTTHGSLNDPEWYFWRDAFLMGP